MLGVITVLAELDPWVRTILVVVFLLIGVIQLVRYAPDFRRRGDGVPDRDDLDRLFGQTGRVLTAMRPVGMCEFDGRRIQCVAESEYVEKGRQVRIVRIEGTQPTVRVVDEP